MNLQDLTYLVVDTETTGLDPAACRVVSVAGVWVRPGTGVLPQGVLPGGPGRAHPARSLGGAPHRRPARAGRAAPGPGAAHLPGADFDVYVAHNAAFDFGFLPAGAARCCAPCAWPGSSGPGLPKAPTSTCATPWAWRCRRRKACPPTRPWRTPWSPPACCCTSWRPSAPAQWRACRAPDPAGAHRLEPGPQSPGHLPVRQQAPGHPVERGAQGLPAVDETGSAGHGPGHPLYRGTLFKEIM